MPKTSVNKYDLPESRKNEVRGSRKITSVKAVSEAKPVGGGPDCKFRLGILPAHLSH